MIGNLIKMTSDKNLDRRRWLAPLLGLSAAVVFAWQAVVLLRYFATPTPANGAR